MNFLSIQQRDPAGTGEDLLHDCQRVLEIAPRYCSDCANYHMLHPFKRYLSSSKGHEDGAALIGILGSLLVKNSAREGKVTDVLIGGAADTGLLGLCVRAAREHLQSTYGRVRYSILDRCSTPLQLCIDYASRNAVDVVVSTVDLTSPILPFRADIIFLHSLLNFVESQDQAQVLKTFASWLNPQGHLVVSTEIRPTADVPASRLRRSSRFSEVEMALRSGLVPVTGDLETLLGYVAKESQAKASHLHEFSSHQELDQLFAEVGLRTLSVSEVASRSKDYHSAGRRHRIIWVLAR